MSFDIIILKPTDLTIEDITAVGDVVPLGATKLVAAVFEREFPGCIENGCFVSGELYAVELTLNGEPVESAHMSLRFGDAWSDEAESQFNALLAKVCLALEALAFAISDNSRIAP